MSDLRTINVNNIDNLLDKIELIDIREPYEYEQKRIETAKNIPMYDLLDDPEEYLDKSKEYHIICEAGRKSLIVAMELNELGFNIVNVSGGTCGYNGKRIKIFK